MKTIVDDPEGFFEQGGWSFLDPESEVSSWFHNVKQTFTFLNGPSFSFQELLSRRNTVLRIK